MNKINNLKNSDIRAIQYEYVVKYNDTSGIKYLNIDVQSEIQHQLDNNVSPIYNSRLYVEKIDRDLGDIIDTYVYEYDSRIEHWTRKENLRRHY